MPTVSTPPTPPLDAVGVLWGSLTYSAGGYNRLSFRAGGVFPPPDDDPAVITPRRPIWKLRIYWDGDGSPPIDYSDHPHADIASAEIRVTNWGQVVQSAKGIQTFDAFRVSLSDVADSGGSRVSDEFTSADPPEGKLVELDVKVIQPEAGPLSGFTTIFTGRISEVPRNDEAIIELIVSSKDEIIDRDVAKTIHLADYPNAPSDSVDRIQPIVFGENFDHEGVLVAANPQAVLYSSLTSTATTVEVESDPGLSASGEVQIDAEKITYAAITAGTPATLTGVVRGTSSTSATDHPAGVNVVQIGAVTWLMAGHPCQSLVNPRLIDSQGNIRQIPDGVTPTIDESSTPSTITLSDQPILSSLSSQVGSSFKFVDLDSVDIAQTDGPLIGGQPPYPLGVAENVIGRSAAFTETNFVTVETGTPVARITGYRAAPIAGLPEGAILKKAYAVVEGFNDGTGAAAVDTTIDAQLLAATAPPFTLNVADTTGFINPAVLNFLSVGDERLSYDAVTATTFNIIGRGLSWTGAITHPASTAVRQGSLEVYVRNPDAGASTTISSQDVVGSVRPKNNTPEEVEAATGLVAITKGFEDSHTHNVAGNHTHVTSTAHEHDTSTIIEWAPNLIQGRKPVPPGATCTVLGQAVDWSALDTIFDKQESVNGIAGDGAAWVFNGLPNPYAQFYLRGTAGSVSPSDTRVVIGYEVTIATRRATVVDNPAGAGLQTVTWIMGTSFCIQQSTTSSSTVGFPRLNIGTELVEGSLASNPDQQGSKHSQGFAIPRGPAVYNANPNSIFVDSFTVDTTADGLQVRDFVDASFGGSVAGQSVWFYWQAAGLAVHSVTFRLVVASVTSTETIADPLDSTDNPDTDTEAPLKTSNLSWFELPMVDEAADLIDLRFQVRGKNNATSFPDDYLVLRMFFALELETVSVSGDTETPTRLICDAQGLGMSDQKATTYAPLVITDATMLNLASGANVDSASWTAAAANVIPGAGVVRSQIKASRLIQDLCDGARLIPVWQGDGTLGATYLQSVSFMQTSQSPVVVFNDEDLQPTEYGISRPRAPLDQIVNEVTIKAAPNAVDGGFGITSNGEDSASKTAYGVTKLSEEEARFVSTQAGADDLRDHRLDYGAESASRVTFRVHFTQKALSNTGPGALIGVDTTTGFSSLSLQVERRMIDFGVGRTGSTPYVEFQCVDRNT